MRKGLFLDDVRFPNDIMPRGVEQYPKDISWDIVRTIDNFIVSVESEKYDVIAFDQYLDDTDPNYLGEDAYHMYQELVKRKRIPLSEVCFHSADPSVRNRLYKENEEFLMRVGLEG